MTTNTNTTPGPWLFLSDARRSLELLQEEFASRAGVTQQTLSDWEGGRIAPSIVRWPRLAQALGITGAELGAAIGAHWVDSEPTPPQPRRRMSAQRAGFGQGKPV